MTKQDDFIKLESMFFGNVIIPLREVNLSWPPPEFLVMDGVGILREATKDDDKQHLLHRTQMSALTDEQIQSCPGIARGAEYKYVVDL